MAEEKICAICKKIIGSRENFCHLIDYKQGEYFMDSYYHTLCYNNQIKGMNTEQKKMKKLSFAMLQRANKLMNKVEGKPEEVYEVT